MPRPMILPVCIRADLGHPRLRKKACSLICGMRRSWLRAMGTASLRRCGLPPKKPWAIDTSYFTSVPKALYLTSMAVHPVRQGKGVGRQLMDKAESMAKAWPSNAIRLDAYDAKAGAGTFYAKCGFREVGRAIYRKTPLVYFE